MRIGTAVSLRNGREECKSACRLGESVSKDSDNLNFYSLFIKNFHMISKTFGSKLAKTLKSGLTLAGTLNQLSRNIRI